MDIRKHFIDTNYLELLETALKNNIQEELYSIGAYREEAFCIEEKKSGWIVYLGERGKQHDITLFHHAIDACNELIARVSESDKEEREVKRTFNFLIKNKISRRVRAGKVRLRGQKDLRKRES